mmetsp:Transcript_44522/g.54500  ORF Transcript_44522/g.54500 Transcript_44522/m.54500 type:complete len:123 (-) Transcript_44522:253-621(-)
MSKTVKRLSYSLRNPNKISFIQLRYNMPKTPMNRVERIEIPEHLTRRGKRQIPEPFLRQLKQIKPISQDNFGKGLVFFIIFFTLLINGLYAYQAYSLKDRLKAKGLIDGDDDERWENLKKSV